MIQRESWVIECVQTKKESIRLVQGIDGHIYVQEVHSTHHTPDRSAPPQGSSRRLAAEEANGKRGLQND